MFKNNRSLLVIAVIALVNALGYGIIIPILYSYSKRFGLTDFQNGAVFALFSACQFVSAPIIGRLSDKYGRKPLLLVSLAGTALSFVMLTFAPNAIILVLARALDGITAGNIPVASAVISDTTEPQDRARGFGIIGASFGFGFFIGPAISGLTVGLGAAIPFLIAAVVTVIAIVMTAVMLPETNKHMGQVREGKLFDFGKLVTSLFEKNIGLTLLITFIYSLAFGSFIYVFQPFSVKVLHLSLQQIALTFSMFGLIGLVSQTLIIPRVIKAFGEKKSLAGSLFVTGITFAAFFFTRNLPIFLVVIVFQSLANGIINPVLQALLSKEVDAKSQGSIQGLSASYGSIGMIIGPIIGGLVATYSVPLPFLVSSLAMFACFLVSLKILKQHLNEVSEWQKA